jgi:hypothetical protein
MNTTKLEGKYIVNEDGFTVYSAEAGAKKAAKPVKEKVKAEAPTAVSSADTALLEKTILGYIDQNNGEISNTAEFCDTQKIAAD